MFDQSQTFKGKILSGGEKPFEVRFPTDREWIDRARKQKATRRFIGRGKSITEADVERADAELFAKICPEEQAANFDAAEASLILGKIARCEVLDSAREGGAYRIRMRVPGGVITHVLNIPFQADISAYARAAVKREDGPRMERYSVNLEPAADLWQKAMQSVDGYAGDVPIIHKDVAVSELLQRIDADSDEDDDPED